MQCGRYGYYNPSAYLPCVAEGEVELLELLVDAGEGDQVLVVVQVDRVLDVLPVLLPVRMIMNERVTIVWMMLTLLIP